MAIGQDIASRVEEQIRDFVHKLRERHRVRLPDAKAVGEGTGDATANRLILRAAAKYRSIDVGETPSTPAMLSKP